MFTDIYISPHMDDIALSCSGAILSKKKQGKNIFIITVFCSDAPNNTIKNKLLFKLYPDLINNNRRSEDSAAMEMMDVAYSWLDFPDIILRSGPFRIFSPSGNFQYDLLYKEIFSSILDLHRSYPTANFYFPMGIGHHIDHLIMSDIGLDFARKNLSPTYFYEDIPYSFANSLRKARFMKMSDKIFVHDINSETCEFDPQKECDDAIKILGQDIFPGAKNIIARIFIKRHLFSMAKESPKTHNNAFQERLEPVTEHIGQYFGKKIEIISEYKTQIPLLFSSSTPWQDIFTRFHPKTEKDEAVEYFWMYKI